MVPEAATESEAVKPGAMLRFCGWVVMLGAVTGVLLGRNTTELERSSRPETPCTLPVA